MTDIAALLKSAVVAPVIRTSTAGAASRAVDLLSKQGFRLFELTLTTPGALELLGELSQRSDLTVGLGTVLSEEQGRMGLEAGAAFLVSPAFVPGLTDLCREASTPVALGAATPTEVLQAHQAGADFVKVFPASQLGGAGFVKALKSVYPEIQIMPTGGINPPDIPAYLQAGAACLGMGGNLVSDAALTAGDDEVILTAAQAVRAQIEVLGR